MTQSSGQNIGDDNAVSDQAVGATNAGDSDSEAPNEKNDVAISSDDRDGSEPSSTSSKSADKEVGKSSDRDTSSEETRSGGGSSAVRVVSNAAQDIGGFIRAQREMAQVSLRQLAERAGVSNPYLSQIERGLRKPSAEVLGQIAKGLRVSAEALYVRAGILEQRESSPVNDAVLADAVLTERQKQVILEIYNSFCHENQAGE
ncbi:helix-turn-helix transcriptional regulator [Hoyosella rhizosphaerae]|uniref:HTH cro/C1-type domain-containing protein n=1 Tax=Hoyosella rhizosphaerae TaxID=1755582 RepID=A0A916XIL6_9ACTN|nr:helix-turn-helix transcriptional regulator [Hoyosella rhizosphaerae]GGC74678.1 hypothetical protein GCM10011410_30030 [Hoyosella rhizosphaerae]